MMCVARRTAIARYSHTPRLRCVFKLKQRDFELDRLARYVCVKMCCGAGKPSERKSEYKILQVIVRS